MAERFVRMQQTFHCMDRDAQAAHMAEYAGGTAQLVNYMYDHLDEFRLLLDCLLWHAVSQLCRYAGTHRGGIHRQIHENRGLSRVDGRRDDRKAAAHRHHIPLREPVRSRPSRHELRGAAEYIALLSRYHRTGCMDIFGARCCITARCPYRTGRRSVCSRPSGKSCSPSCRGFRWAR